MLTKQLYDEALTRDVWSSEVSRAASALYSRHSLPPMSLTSELKICSQQLLQQVPQPQNPPANFTHCTIVHEHHSAYTVSTDLRHHFFSDRVVNIWNSLDNRTVTSGSINIFKGNLERLRQSKEIDLFVGNWCYLIFWGWTVPSGRPCLVSYTVSYIAFSAHTLLQKFNRKFLPDFQTNRLRYNGVGYPARYNMIR